MGWDDQEGQVTETEHARVLKAISGLLKWRGERKVFQARKNNIEMFRTQNEQGKENTARTEEERSWGWRETKWKSQDEENNPAITC